MKNEVSNFGPLAMRTEKMLMDLFLQLCQWENEETGFSDRIMTILEKLGEIRIAYREAIEKGFISIPGNPSQSEISTLFAHLFEIQSIYRDEIKEFLEEFTAASIPEYPDIWGENERDIGEFFSSPRILPARD